MEQVTDVASLDPQATVEHAVPENLRQDVAKIIETARTGWLTKYQVLYLLEHRQMLGLPLSTTTPQLPASALRVAATAGAALTKRANAPTGQTRTRALF